MTDHGQLEWPTESDFPNAESWLLAIWRELFGQDVDSADNFFDLGGDSALAMEAAALVQDAGYPGLPTSAVFRWPTVAQLAVELASYAP